MYSHLQLEKVISNYKEINLVSMKSIYVTLNISRKEMAY